MIDSKDLGRATYSFESETDFQGVFLVLPQLLRVHRPTSGRNPGESDLTQRKQRGDPVPGTRWGRLLLASPIVGGDITGRRTAGRFRASRPVHPRSIESALLPVFRVGTTKPSTRVVECAAREPPCRSKCPPTLSKTCDHRGLPSHTRAIGLCSSRPSSRVPIGAGRAPDRR